MWKLRWNYFLIWSYINSTNRAAVKEEQTNAELKAPLSDNTLKWLRRTLREAQFIIQKIKENIQDTTNP